MSDMTNLSLQELGELRRKTHTVSTLLHDRLTRHLETLRPLMGVESVFGKFAGSKTETAATETAMRQIADAYRPFASKPYDLPSDFDPYWLQLVGNRAVLYPWEYACQVKSERETKTVAITCPVRWVLSFSSAYTLAQMRQALAGEGERHPENIRQFVVNTLAMQAVLARQKGLTSLFADLRYEVRAGSVPDLPNLTLTTLSCNLPSFRPSDDLILAAIGFSGVPSFVELIEIHAAMEIKDPFRTQMEAALA
jgi:hypothetical protein